MLWLRGELFDDSFDVMDVVDDVFVFFLCEFCGYKKKLDFYDRYSEPCSHKIFIEFHNPSDIDCEIPRTDHGSSSQYTSSLAICVLTAVKKNIDEGVEIPKDDLWYRDCE